MASQLNPLKCKSVDLPANLVLMVKVIVVGFFLKGCLDRFPEIFLPFVPFFDVLRAHVIPPDIFRLGMQTIFVVAAVLLFFNVQVKRCSLILGTVIFVNLMASRLFYSNNIIYCGCIFFLTGLQQGTKNLWMFRWQLGLMYFGAGLNKLLEPDWQSGRYTDYWMRRIVEQFRYDFWAKFFPPMVLAKILGMSAAVTEFGLSIGFLVKRWYRIAIWGGIIFHATLLLISREDFGIYTIAIFASYLAFVPWPEKIQVTYNPRLKWLQWLLSKVDFDATFRWVEGKEALGLKVADRKCRGFAAFKVVLLYLPVTYFFLTLLLCVPDEGMRSRLVMLLLLIFCPLIDILEELVLMIRNRN